MTPLDPYKVIEFYLPWILKQFQLPNKFHIFLVDGKNPENPKNYGYYSHDHREVVLYMGANSTIEKVLDTLAHELKHVEQYFLSKLSAGWHGNKHWKEDPNSNNFRSYSASTLEDHYWYLPWEVEAREAAKEFLDKFHKLHKNFDIIRRLEWRFFKPSNKKVYHIG